MDIKLLAIGGYSEIGRNMSALKIGDEFIIIDMGIHLPTVIKHEAEIEDLSRKQLQKLGAIPNDYILEKYKDKVKGIFIGHAHLDHIGAIPNLASKYDCPIYATPYTIEVIKKILKDKNIKIRNQLKVISPNQKVTVSKNISVEFINMTHSIPQTAMLAVHTPKGTILYANDFKFDNSPVLGKPPNFNKLKSLKNVILLIVDALYADRDGKTPSEKVARELLRDVLLGTDNKGHAIIVTTFASQIARLKSILEFGRKLGRKVVFLGRSLNKYIDAAEKVNIVNFSRKSEIIGYRQKIQNKLTQIEKQGRSGYLIVCTGHQGEPDAVLASMVNKKKYKFPIYPGDHVIFSSSIIPNKENIEHRAVLDKNLKKMGVRIFTDIHSSGHASREDLRDLIRLTKPKIIVPAHANKPKYSCFVELAKEEGYRYQKNVILLKDGELLDIK